MHLYCLEPDGQKSLRDSIPDATERRRTKEEQGEATTAGLRKTGSVRKMDKEESLTQVMASTEK